MSSTENAYNKGYQAAFDKTSNPFKYGSIEWISWERGYLDSMNDNFVDWFKEDE